MKKLGVLAIMAVLLVALAALRPTAQTPVAEADLAAPGGIAALPSAVPAVPGIANQGIPAIIGTGMASIVSVFCATPAVGDLGLPFVAGPCPDVNTNPSTNYGTITLKLEQVYPASGVPMATFAATGTDSLVVTDNGGGDMDIQIGVVSVEVDSAAATMGGTQGVNEIVKVTATDETGAARYVNIVVVDTMLAWGPTGQVSTASQEQPVFISYACDRYGRSPIADASAVFAETLTATGVGEPDGMQGLDDMYDALYGPFNGPGLGWGSNTLLGDADFADVWCGGDTAAGLFDDFVDFETDLGMFSIDPAGVSVQQSSYNLAFGLGYFFPPSLDFDCGEGKNIDTFDIDGLSVWGAFLFSGALEGGCDLDGWRNSVVTTELVGTGQAGVATISAQQGGGVSPTREINVTFVGEAALSLFIDAPESLGINGGDFTAIVVDQDGRPVGDETVQCTVDPAGGALAILNQTGTTGAITSDNPGEVTFNLIPTGASVIGGEELTITCVLDRDRSVSATETISLSSTPDLESVALVEGCNPVASTYADATPIATAAGAVAPAEALDAIWKFDPATGTWLGYSPSAPAAVSDLDSIDFLDAVFICVNAASTWSRPVI
jgi:hypothetical protein